LDLYIRRIWISVEKVLGNGIQEDNHPSLHILSIPSKLSRPSNIRPSANQKVLWLSLVLGVFKIIESIRMAVENFLAERTFWHRRCDDTMASVMNEARPQGHQR